jgi:hypothetical protein
MSDPGPIAVALGVLLIVSRGPLLVAPEATTAFYRGLLSNPLRVRALGVMLGLLGVATIATGSAPEGLVHYVLLGVGWLMALAAPILMVAPSLYMGLADAVLEQAQSADAAILRGLGALGIAIGGLLVHWGLTLA